MKRELEATGLGVEVREGSAEELLEVDMVVMSFVLENSMGLG